MERNQKNFPWWEKYTLSIEEASEYYGIGEKSLRRFLKSNNDLSFIIQIGNHTRIKKNEFSKYLDRNINIL